jgi:acetyltransferase-like isoleucine patch superfamily enzyme
MLDAFKGNIFYWAKQGLSNYWFSRLFQLIQQARLLMMKKDIGPNTFIDKTVQVNGWQSVNIGHSSVISEYAWLNVNTRKEGVKHIVIGNNCSIGKRVLLSAAHQVLVGDYCMIFQDCKLLGSDHVFSDPLTPYAVTGTTSEGVIKLESNVSLGAGAIIVGNVTIGRGSVIGAGSIITSDIPPFSIAVGVPCRIIKRFDFKDHQWVQVKDYNADQDSLIPGEAEYLNLLKNKFPKINFPLQGASRAFGDLV